MPRSTVTTNPATDLDRLIGGGKRNRCACCGGPTLTVLDVRGDIMLCSRCARFCTVKGGSFTHVSPARIDRGRAERIWSVDLGFKKLGA